MPIDTLLVQNIDKGLRTDHSVTASLNNIIDSLLTALK